jgi:uncharacterized protein (TIGR03790 family)
MGGYVHTSISWSCAALLRLRLVALVGVSMMAASAPTFAQTAENVALVVNDSSAASQKIGEYYAKKRSIPPGNVIHIRTSVDDAIDRRVYTATIEEAIGTALSRAGLQDRILYLVLTKDVPLRIVGTGQANGTTSSVDSELTLLYRRLTGQNVPVPGRVDNPYFLGDRGVAGLSPFNHRDYDIYLVTRLDGFTVDDVIGLIDRGSAPVRDGRIVLDQQDKLVNRVGEDWLASAAKKLEAQGQGERVVLETTVNPVRDVSPVLGYYSWGSNDPRNRVRKLGMGFVPGALAATFVSTDARTFHEPPAGWLPTDDVSRDKWFAGSAQSLSGDLIREGATGVAGQVTLSGDLIREGATGVAGQVSEPFLQSAVRPELLFTAYLAGANLAEAFYAALPHLSWEAVVVGDPLCAPFRQTSAARGDIDAGVDGETLLPAFFSNRRLASLTRTWSAASEKALKLTMKGDVMLGRGEMAAARTAFEEATAQSPQIAPAQLALAVFLDSSNQVDAAIERYRQTLTYQPTNATALNNLAYRLAVDKKSPAEALPLAQQAVKIDQAPTVLDTLAWIQHLLGDAGAVRTMAAALQGAPNNADIRLHAAIIYAASGARAVAEDQLKEAIKLKPSLESSPEVREVRQQLQKLGAPQSPANPTSKKK